MDKNILLVGVEYTGPTLPDTNVDNLGLCRPEKCDDKAAFSLYEYDVIIINPQSYSHFIFGVSGKFSGSKNELWDLKQDNNNYDLDTIYDFYVREAELNAAIAQGTRVIWLLTEDKPIHFFGWRNLYLGYANSQVINIVRSSNVYQKKSKKMVLDKDDVQFRMYFEQLQIDGWRNCIASQDESISAFARTPDGYILGAEVTIGNKIAWLLTAPPTKEATNKLVLSSLGLESSDVSKNKYHGIFLSHTGSDKPFVRKLKSLLETHGVENVWLDEAEIQIGDSLTKKIDEGLKMTKYIGVVLSTRSIKSPWVEKELEIAINRELTTGEVIVLPLLYEKCELPTFLIGKLYADFTSEEEYGESIQKLLRRLKV